MSRRAKKELCPRNGHALVVGVVCRISGTGSQTETSLDDQFDHGREEVEWLYKGEIEYRIVSTAGKGERLDRPELAEVRAMIRTGELDLLVMDDAGRLIRGAAAVELWGLAVDHGVRCIAPSDGLDTDDDWEQDLLDACREHVGHNVRTSKRLKKRLRARFLRKGEAVGQPVYGYHKPDDSTSYDDWRIDDAAKLDDIREAARLLRETLNCSLVGEWLNDRTAPTGPYCRSDDWDGRMVRRYFNNSLLKGLPARGHRHTVKHHQTGRRISVRNPDGPEYYDAPHLAILDPDEFDDLNAALAEHNAGVGRKKHNGVDPQKGRPKSRTRYPGSTPSAGTAAENSFGGQMGTTTGSCATVHASEGAGTPWAFPVRLSQSGSSPPFAMSCSASRGSTCRFVTWSRRRVGHTRTSARRWPVGS